MEPTFSPAWFATFGRPEPAVTAREIDFLANVLPRPPATVLDVPCGLGRHARALETHVVLDVYNPAFFRKRQGRADNQGVREHKRIENNRLRTTLDYPDGSRDEFEWRLYEPEELEELGSELGLRRDPRA